MATWRGIPQHNVGIHPLTPIMNMPAHVPEVSVALTHAIVGDNNMEDGVGDLSVRPKIAGHAVSIDHLESIKLRS